MREFKVEYAKSGSASCKECKGAISQDSLRLAVMVQSSIFDGKIPNWFHYACFWKRAKCLSHTQFGGFDSLRSEDQEKIKEKITGSGGGGDTADGATAFDYKDFTVEYAKSNQSTCRACNEKIGKGEVRIAKKEYDSQRAKMYGPVDLWHHVDCFVKNRDDLEFGTEFHVEKITGWVNIRIEDQEELMKKLDKGEKGKKRKAAVEEGTTGGKKAKKSKEDTEEETTEGQKAKKSKEDTAEVTTRKKAKTSNKDAEEETTEGQKVKKSKEDSAEVTTRKKAKTSKKDDKEETAEEQKAKKSKEDTAEVTTREKAKTSTKDAEEETTEEQKAKKSKEDTAEVTTTKKAKTSKKDTEHTASVISCKVREKMNSSTANLPENGWITYRQGDQPYEGFEDWLNKNLPSMHHKSKGISWICVRGKNQNSKGLIDLSQLRKMWCNIQNSNKPINVDTISDLARICKVTNGKWLFYVDSGVTGDHLWSIVAKAIIKGLIPSDTAKVSPSDEGTNHVICVYNSNYLDKDEVFRCEQGLRKIGIKCPLMYKPDVYTYLGIYSYNLWNLRPTLFRIEYDIMSGQFKIKRT